ncbi:hypothetical protein AX774_g8125 [Zancudomyces culisetae]|uniref:Uncharacterized protein n=1 Tax=Zancudomyces culisetae TaxID=1213189 RepID=A0A1R1PBY2_ZANCU|nr:hypothetical protein AX774_g8125 [Zancudomyces culisetae]|eukprot:OMH78485.1 hypothetical protein AX774_g8125 [Zancudomyces culisetae]
MPRLIGRKKRRGSMNLAKNVLIDFGTDKNTDSNVNTNLSSTVNTKASTETNTNTGTNTNTNNKSYSLTIENSSEANILYCDKAKNSNLNNKGNKARDNTQYPVVYNKRVHSKNNQLENLQTQPDIDGGVDFSAHSDLAKNLKLNLDLSASLNQPIITDSQEATSVKSQSGGILFNIASVSTDFSIPSSKTSIKDNEKIYNSSSEQVVVKFRNSQTIPELSFTESSSIDANNNALSDRGIECSNNTSEKISTSSSATTNATFKMIQPGNGNTGNDGVCAQEGEVQESQQHTEERPEETSRIGEPSLDQDTEGNTGIMIGKGKNQKNKTKKENKTPVYSFKRWIWGSNSEGSSNISSPQKEKAINIFKRQKLSVEAQETTIERQDSVDIPSSCGTEMSIANKGPSDNSNNEEAVVDAIKDTGEEVDTSKSITNIAQQGTQGLLEIEENHEREHKQEQEKQKINNSSGSGDFILNQNDKGKTKEGVEGAEKINKAASEKSIGIKELVEVETKAIQMEEQVTNTDSRNNSISYSVNERGGARGNEGEHGNEIGEGSESEFEFERRSKYRSTTKWIWWKSKKEDQKVETEQYDYEQERQEVEGEKHGQQIKVGTKRQLGIKQTVVRIHDGAETNNNEQGSLEEHNKTEGEALKVKDTGDVDDGDIKMMVDREEVGWREYISSFYYSSEKVEKSIDIQEREAGQKNKAGSTIEKRQEKQSERDGKGGEASENKLGMKSIVEPKLEYRRYRNEAGSIDFHTNATYRHNRSK